MTWQTIDPSVTVPCDNCGNGVEIVGSKVYPNGETQPMQTKQGATWNLGGGYNEFIDSWDTDTHVVLCHDCTLAVFRALPGVVKKWYPNVEHHYESLGWHPYNGSPPCCEFGWTLDESDNRSEKGVRGP